MDRQNEEDIKDIAQKLDEIRTYCPEDYFYLKGWIHCLSHKENGANRPQCSAAKAALGDGINT